MTQERKLRSLTYVYACGFEAAALQKHAVRKRVRRTAMEPGAADGPEARRKGRAKHDKGVAWER